MKTKDEILIECPSCKNKSTLKWLNFLRQCEYCKIDFPQNGFEAPKEETIQKEGAPE